MEPSGPVGRAIKPFVETGFRDWVRNASGEAWFRKVFMVDKDSAGNGFLYIGGKKGMKFPLDKGIAGLTAASGLAHVTIPNYPMMTWILNEMIDEIGPALRDAYKNGRIPTEEEVEEAQKALKEAGKIKVRVIRYDGDDPDDPSDDTYSIHHLDCFSRHVMKTSQEKGKGGGKKGQLVPLKSALVMGAMPTDYCAQCMDQIGSLVKEIDALKVGAEGDMPSATEKPPKVSAAEVLMMVTQLERERFDDFIYAWVETHPGKRTTQEIDRLLDGLDRVSEVRYLASSRSLPEFQRRMRTTLKPKTAAGTAIGMATQAWGVATDSFRRLTDGGTEEETYYQNQMRQFNNTPTWKKFLRALWPL